MNIRTPFYAAGIAGVKCISPSERGEDALFTVPARDSTFL
ncbi:hypothetical protein PAECIP111893_03856 [Paenibacillus plantiphilus]|uniref:Uncharacterized protein n=1 Tax=Paenibacillus plantiphilus TaxID=2905650 RepID=A0ABM9CKB7_9BACL|nr:hypothetical protein PAECIP111893_03856 [Paenibacillus plantiphilus]